MTNFSLSETGYGLPHFAAFGNRIHCALLGFWKKKFILNVTVT